MNFTLITASNFFFFCNFSSFFLLPVFIRDLGGGEAQIGYIMGSFGVTSLLCIPFVSAMSDRGGRKAFMAAGAALMTGASVCFLFIDSLGYAIYILRLIQGAGFAAFFTSAAAAVSDVAEKDRIAERLGIFGAFTIFSYAVGPGAGEWIMQTRAAEGLFVYSSVFGGVSFILALLVKDENFKPQAGRRWTGGFFNLVVAKRYRTILFANLMLAVGLGSLLNFFAVFSSESGFAASRFFLTYAVTVITVRILSSKLADRVGRKTVAAPALFVAAVSLFLVSQARSDLQAVLFCILFSAGYGLLYPALGAMITDRTKTGMAKAMGAFNSSFSVGINYAAFPLGIAAEMFGLRAMYAIAGAAVLCGFFVFLIFERETAETAKT